MDLCQSENRDPVHETQDTRQESEVGHSQSGIPADLGGFWHQAAWSRASLKNSFISALRVSRS